MKQALFYSHPFLFALYSVVFLYANNLKEYRLSVIVTPLVIAFCFAGIVFLLSKLFVKNIEKSALISSLIIVVSLSYQRLLDFTKNLDITLGSLQISNEQIVPVLCLLILGLSVGRIMKYKKSLLAVNKFVTILTLVLLLFSLFKAISYEVKTQRLWKTPQKPVTKIEKKGVATKNSPDIYYIIFDRYGGKKSLQEQLNFDNTPFLSFLENKGFYVATESTTNYPKTFLSLASSLNLEYVDYLTEQTEGGKSSDESLANPLIENNKALKFLKEKGYSYVHMGSWWTPTATNKNAEVVFTREKPGYFNADEFTTGFLNTTIIAPILKSVFREPTAVSKYPQNNNHRSIIYYQFETFKKIPKIPGPKFVFAHILLPHEPFVLDKNCNPLSEEIVFKRTHQENYIDQIQCANKKIEELVAMILKESKTSPIIILQADEGPFPMNSMVNSKQSWATATTQALEEKFPILNAYYFPEASKTASLYPSITPVNSFRVLFNSYFGTNYELLPDKNYIFQDGENYYKFLDVTEKLK